MTKLCPEKSTRGFFFFSLAGIRRQWLWHGGYSQKSTDHEFYLVWMLTAKSNVVLYLSILESNRLFSSWVNGHLHRRMPLVFGLSSRAFNSFKIVKNSSRGAASVNNVPIDTSSNKSSNEEIFAISWRSSSERLGAFLTASKYCHMFATMSFARPASCPTFMASPIALTGSIIRKVSRLYWNMTRRYKRELIKFSVERANDTK